jgi:hypothetical protein
LGIGKVLKYANVESVLGAFNKLKSRNKAALEEGQGTSHNVKNNKTKTESGSSNINKNGKAQSAAVNSVNKTDSVSSDKIAIGSKKVDKKIVVKPVLGCGSMDTCY